MGFCCTNYCMQLVICPDDGCGIIHSHDSKKSVISKRLQRTILDLHNV
jgi:hypothetical protein